MPHHRRRLLLSPIAAAAVAVCLAPAAAASTTQPADETSTPTEVSKPVTVPLVVEDEPVADLTSTVKALGVKSGDIVLAGNWDKRGKAGFAVISDDSIELSDGKDTKRGSWASYDFVAPNGRPVVGHFGTQRDTIAVHSDRSLHLRRWFTDGPADRIFDYGIRGDDVIMADLDGDGYSGPVARRGNAFHVRYHATTGPGNYIFELDDSIGDIDEMAAGDFDGDGKDDIVVRSGRSVVIVSPNRVGAYQEKVPVTTIGKAELESDDLSLLVADFDGDGGDDLGVIPSKYSATADMATKGEPTDAPTESDDEDDDAKPSSDETLRPESGEEMVAGKDLETGVYRVYSEKDDCSVSVLYADGKTQSGQVQGDENAKVYLSLSKGDALTVTGCLVKRVDPKDDSNELSETPGDGEWLVGVDVKAGTYKVTGGEGCFATVLGGTDRDAEFVTSVGGSGESITVKNGQLISSESCTWSRR